MYPYLESIRLENKKLHLMQEHEVRFRQTQRDNWGRVLYQDLTEILHKHPDFPTDAHKYKCRVVYSPDRLDCEFLPYHPREITSLLPVFIDDIEYNYKSTNRTVFEDLTRDIPDGTEILIFKKQLLTDSSFSNIALFDGSQWHTPKTPLLKGVHRSHLIKKGILKETDIAFKAVKQFQQVKLINAMMDWSAAWTLTSKAIL